LSQGSNQEQQQPPINFAFSLQLSGAGSSSTSQSSGSSGRLLILGWDGADWDLLDPLLSRGELPHLAALLARGNHALLASLEPRLSPLLWTSAVTGVTPDRHGVLNFVEPAPDGQGLRLATSTSRHCRALWNLLQISGLPSHVVNWYATHPAEPISGIVLSNQFFQASEPPAESVHPADQLSAWLRARHGAATAALATRARTLPLPALPRQPEDEALINALGAAAERAETIHQLSLRLAAQRDWQALLVFQEWIDVAGHHAMAYAPPRQPHIPERQQRLFGGVIEAVYREHDRMLGELLAAAGDELNVILLSDHGFQHGATRPKLSGVALGDDRAEQEASWHRPFGILAMAGPGVRPGTQAATPSLLDITPTALALLGLPAGADMDGRVLVELLAGDPPAPIPSWQQIDGDAGEHPAELRLDPFEAHEAVKQLIDLGYLAAMPPGQDERVSFVRRETHFNRAVVFARSGRSGQAIPWLEALVEQQPRQPRYALLLVECLLAEGNAQAALAHAEAFLERQPLSSAMRLQQVLALLALSQPEQARRQLPLIRPGSSAEHLNLAEIHAQLQQPQAAADHYRAALADTSLAIPAHLGMARLALAAGEAEQAAEHCLDAQAFSLQVPEAHLLLALCLAWLEMNQEASLSCGHALALQPHSRAALLLQTCLARLLGDTSAAVSNLQQLENLCDTRGKVSGPAQERLLPEVMDWIRTRAVPCPIRLERL
jgi:predicted AlkP superfamily phosphohydrolase/phosphomutase/tetratricopeptide (TPR) repeat protein